jgi:hypothetical protein
MSQDRGAATLSDTAKRDEYALLLEFITDFHLTEGQA